MTRDLGMIYDSDGQILLKLWESSPESGRRPLCQHSHIFFEIALVVSGSGTYSVGGREYSIERDSVLVFSSNEQHYITDIGESGLKIINLHFEPRLLWGRSFDSLTENHLNFCFAHSDTFENLIPPERSHALRNTFSMLISELSEKREEYALQVKSLLNTMIIELIREHGYSAKTAGISRDKHKIVRDTVRYIDAHFSEDLSLELLARRSGMSPNYFSAFFHVAGGITLWDYINSRRVEAAMRLLKDEKSLNILEIAVQCGFNNTANFNMVFKKITSMTPSNYRLFGDALS